MFRRKIADHDYENLSHKLAQIAKRTENGFLPFHKVMESLRLILEGRFGQSSVVLGGAKFFKVSVNYNYPLENMIMCGGYDQITIQEASLEKVGLDKRGVEEILIKLFNFNAELTTEEVLDRLQMANFRPVNLPELLAFGSQYSNEQRYCRRIVSLWPYGGRIPEQAFCLGGHIKKRTLTEYDGVNVARWSADTCFAAVRI